MELKEKNRESKLIVFARQNYSGLEKDIIYHVINHLPEEIDVENWPKDRLFTIHLPANELNETNYRRLTKACKSLITKTIGTDEPELKHFSKFAIFPGCELKEGILKISLHPEALPQFTAFKNGYSYYSIREILNLNGAHAKRIFEMLNAYVNHKEPERRIFKIEANELKNLLGIPDKYKGRHSMLKSEVIQPAIEQINDKTSLNVTFESKRENKQTIFTFYPTKKSATQKNISFTGIDNLPEWVNINTYKWILAIGFDEKQLNKLITDKTHYERFKIFAHNFKNEIKNGIFTNEITRGKFYNYIKTGRLE